MLDPKQTNSAPEIQLHSAVGNKLQVIIQSFLKFMCIYVYIYMYVLMYSQPLTEYFMGSGDVCWLIYCDVVFYCSARFYLKTCFKNSY